MTNILHIDNFAKLANLTYDNPWIGKYYAMFNKFTAQSNAVQQQVSGKSALQLTGRSTSQANWGLGLVLPTAPDTYTVGMRILGTPATSQGSASMGVVANPSATECDVVLAIELIPTGARIHYKDATGPKVETVAFAYTSGNTYIDWSIQKQSNTINEMSRFILTVNNFPAFVGDIFNNAGQDLIVAIAGVMSITPDDSIGYLRHQTISDLAPTNLGYAITDVYLSSGGKRFGNPNVETAAINAITATLQSNTEKTVQEVLSGTHSDWEFAQGSGITSVTFDAIASEVSQVRAVLQTSEPAQLQPVQLSIGQATNNSSIFWQPSTVSVLTDGSPNTATLEIP